MIDPKIDDRHWSYEKQKGPHGHFVFVRIVCRHCGDEVYNQDRMEELQRATQPLSNRVGSAAFQFVGSIGLYQLLRRHRAGCSRRAVN